MDFKNFKFLRTLSAFFAREAAPPPHLAEPVVTPVPAAELPAEMEPEMVATRDMFDFSDLSKVTTEQFAILNFYGGDIPGKLASHLESMRSGDADNLFEMSCFLHNLTSMMLAGTGVNEITDRQASTLAIMAADRGHARGSMIAGYCYAAGRHVEQDKARALAYFQAARDKGLAEDAQRAIDSLPEIGPYRQEKVEVTTFDPSGRRAARHFHINY